MPDYPSLVRSESSTPASIFCKLSTLSRKASTGLQQATSSRSWDAQDTETDVPNGRAFAIASNSRSFSSFHFTSSHLDPYPRQRECRPTISSVTSFAKSTNDHDDSFRLKADTDSDDSLASSELPAAPVAENSSAFSHFSMKTLLFAKQVPLKARSGLVFLRRKVYPGSDPKPFLTMADKLTQKWPQPRPLRSMPPELRGDLHSSNGLWGLKGVGDWSQGNMEAALRDSQGLGVDRVGQWTLHKWCLLASVTTVFLLGLTFLVFSILTWFAVSHILPGSLPRGTSYPYHRFPSSHLDYIQLFLAFARFACWVTGTLLNSRPILAVYVLLLFPSFISFVSVGYVTYKKATFSLDAKASQAWNLWYSAGARTVLQGALGCCGWGGPVHGAAASGACYPRSALPGCHGPLVRFELEVLTSAWGTVFSLVPLHLANVFVGLLCANHVTRRFGKGLTPARYRLTADDILSAGLVDQKTASLPVPPFAAPTSHGTFREDRRSAYWRAGGQTF
ncbi:hypothetical protein EI94DRAFT_1727831 [Lactarius quietus]|nr:hypothetical protein EI94DRAFT_1727831 [Lactarius quietus]